MKAKKENLEDQLQQLLDQREDQGRVERLILKSEEINQELNELKKTDTLLKNMSTDHPSEGFTQRVMSHLDDVKFSKVVNRQALLLLLGVFISLLVTGLLLNPSSTNLFQLPDGFSVVGQEISLEKIVRLFDGGMLIKGLMFVAFLLAMLLFDQVVLRPFFQRKKAI